MTEKLKILFLCTGNSCRSQMAEGWVRHLHPAGIEPYSAGIRPGSVDPRAIAVMAEVGVDISTHRSKHLDELAGARLDWIVTVCDHARETCPVFLGNARKLHAGFDDPPRLASEAATESEALAHYRRIRDEIRTFVEKLPAQLEEDGNR